MPEPAEHSHDPALPGPQMRNMLYFVERLILDGVYHGHFGLTIRSEIGSKGRRDVVVEAGKSHKFTIPADELPRRAG